MYYMDPRLVKACHGKSKSKGGMNLPELRAMAQKLGHPHTGTREEVLSWLCAAVPAKPAKRTVKVIRSEILELLDNNYAGGDYPDDESMDHAADSYEDFLKQKIVPLCTELLAKRGKITKEIFAKADREFCDALYGGCTVVDLEDYL